MKVTIIMGAPASGKSTLAEKVLTDGCVHLNRDTEGGRTFDLLPKMAAALRDGRDVVTDNLFTTANTRKPFIELAKKHGATVIGQRMDTSIEDAQINALHRMIKKHGRLFFTAQDTKGIDDPGVFPVAVLFRYRKDLEKPVITEGFDELTTVKFVREPSLCSNKAVLLDYDGTLRESTGDYPYPVKPGDVKVIPGVAEKLMDYIRQGYMLLGISNQSGIGKGVLTDDEVQACFEETHKQIGIQIYTQYCPHKVPPISCYCRKPQSGMGVNLIEQFKLNPAQCIMVGDQTTDKTFAKRLGFQFEFAHKFFKRH